MEYLLWNSEDISKMWIFKKGITNTVVLKKKKKSTIIEENQRKLSLLGKWSPFPPLVHQNLFLVLASVLIIWGPLKLLRYAATYVFIWTLPSQNGTTLLGTSTNEIVTFESTNQSRRSTSWCWLLCFCVDHGCRGRFSGQIPCGVQ